MKSAKRKETESSFFVGISGYLVVVVYSISLKAYLHCDES